MRPAPPTPRSKESTMRLALAARVPALAALVLLAACGQRDTPAPATGAGADAAPAAAGAVQLCTAREPGRIHPLRQASPASSGIQVHTVFVRDGLLERARAEGQRSPADVLMTADTGTLLDLVGTGQTQAV